MYLWWLTRPQIDVVGRETLFWLTRGLAFVSGEWRPLIAPSGGALSVAVGPLQHWKQVTIATFWNIYWQLCVGIALSVSWNFSQKRILYL